MDVGDNDEVVDGEIIVVLVRTFLLESVVAFPSSLVSIYLVFVVEKRLVTFEVPVLVDRLVGGCDGILGFDPKGRLGLQEIFEI